jgi:hypothetical protein
LFFYLRSSYKIPCLLLRTLAVRTSTSRDWPECFSCRSTLTWSKRWSWLKNQGIVNGLGEKYIYRIRCYLRIRDCHIFENVKSLFKQGGRCHVHLQEGQVEGEEGDGVRQP